MLSKKPIKGFILNYPDLWYTFVVYVHDYNCEFLIYEINSQDDENYYWLKDGAMSSMEETVSLINAEIYCDGWVKWDGCSDWSFGDYHFCSKEQAMRVGIIMGIAYDLTKEHCPNWMDL